MKNFFKTVDKPSTAQLIEKKSNFIALIYPVQNEKMAIDYINEARKKYYDARHIVFAYKIRENNIGRFSDDGEPQGTAGVPILEIITKNELVDILIIVVRYFGGILLGAGGLIRAYSKAAAMGLSEIVTMSECIEFSIICPYNILGKIEYILKNCDCKKISIEYNENIILVYYIQEEFFEKLQVEITDATNGDIIVSVCNKNFYKI
jgi:uncharacterized YigZ family protein